MPENVFNKLQEQCEYLLGSKCLKSSEMASKTVMTTEKACLVCLAQSSRTNHVTASLALRVIDRPIPKEKEYLMELIKKEQIVVGGPGTELKKLISWFPIPKARKDKCGRCKSLELKMNAWGPSKCEAKRTYIRRKLIINAKRMGVPSSEFILDMLITRAICNVRPVLKPVIQHDKRWSVAVTTAPRKDCNLLQCIESIRRCGWEPVVFAEPGSTPTDCVTFWNETRKGVWHNWRAASEWCLAQQTEFVMTVQDDSIFHPDTRDFANKILWPPVGSVGYVSFYTPQHYQQWQDGRQRPFGVYPVNTNSVWGAMALTFPPAVLRQLLDHPRALSWLGAKPSWRTGESKEQYQARYEAMKETRIREPWLIQNSDTAIGIILRKFLKKKLVYISPSPVDHCSKYSSIGHGGNAGKRNAIYIADPARPLYPQVFEPLYSQVIK